MSAGRSQAERIAALERRLASVDAKVAAIFDLMAEATVAAGISTGGNPEGYAAEAHAQARRRSLHVVRPGDTQ